MPALVTPDEKGLERWRFDQFYKLTQDAEIAYLLAISPADLGLARTMMEQGCTPDQLARILA